MKIWDPPFNQSRATKHLNKMIKKHNVIVGQWLDESKGFAYMPHQPIIDIPKPTDVDRFAVCMHEIKHVIDGNTKARIFEQEFDANIFALQQVRLLGFDARDWKRRMQWHCLHQIAVAINKGLTADIPDRIKQYFNYINFNRWYGNKVYVESDCELFEIRITVGKRVKYRL